MSLDLSSARAETFEPHVGSAFHAMEEAASLELSAIERFAVQSHAPRTDPFSLLFIGPAGIQQGVLTLSHPALGTIELFVVRLGPGPDGRHRYEAAFN